MNPLSVKNCPSCGTRARCIDSRPTGAHVRRRYHCPACNRRWTTLEAYTEDFFQQPRRALVLASLRNVEDALGVLRRRIRKSDEDDGEFC